MSRVLASNHLKIPVCRGGGTKRKDKASAKGFKEGNPGGPKKTPTSTQCKCSHTLSFGLFFENPFQTKLRTFFSFVGLK